MITNRSAERHDCPAGGNNRPRPCLVHRERPLADADPVAAIGGDQVELSHDTVPSNRSSTSVRSLLFWSPMVGSMPPRHAVAPLIEPSDTITEPQYAQKGITPLNLSRLTRPALGRTYR